MPAVTVEHPLGAISTLVRDTDGFADVHLLSRVNGTAIDVRLDHAAADGTYPVAVSVFPLGATAPYTLLAALSPNATAVTQQYGSFSLTVGAVGEVLTVNVQDTQADLRVEFRATPTAGGIPDAFGLTLRADGDRYDTIVGGFTAPVAAADPGDPVTATVAADGDDLTVSFAEVGRGAGFDVRVGRADLHAGGAVTAYFSDGTLLDAELPEADHELILGSGDGRFRVTLALPAHGPLTVTGLDTVDGQTAAVTAAYDAEAGATAVTVTAANAAGATRSASGTVAAGSSAPTASVMEITTRATSDGSSATEFVGQPATDGTAVVTLQFQSGTTTSFTTTVGGTSTPLPVTDNATFQHTEQFDDGATLTVSLFAANADGTVPAVMVITNGAVAFGMSTTLQSQEATNFSAPGAVPAFREAREAAMLKAELAALEKRIAVRLRTIGNYQRDFDAASKRGDLAGMTQAEDLLRVARADLEAMEKRKKEILKRLRQLGY